MEIAMLMIGLLLGGCVSFCILGCMQINRINDYEDEIRRLRTKEKAKTEYLATKSPPLILYSQNKTSKCHVSKMQR